MKAVPFYDKRNNKMYPTKSDFNQSWNSTIHSRPQSVNAGMGSNKPLSSVIYILINSINQINKEAY